ncbi:kinase-like protein [Calocera viscosa TUFC12733]|uniref:Kinase-like protein n=1 Tax=Calocera viscosa (strain TUFC12733) TaxID=1330018 RepID=A0A167PSC5_CALVF|nr:kinase-like protein [Calocera viscosa TUFC12733]
MDILRSAPDITSGITGLSNRPITTGGGGDIYKADFKRAPVAVKVIRRLSDRDSARWIKLVRRELTNWMRLSHPNILEFYGVCRHGPYGFALVSPWMHHGGVLAYLLEYPHANRANLLLDVATGLKYLHSLDPPLVHGDLSARNILVRESGEACLADFGLSRVLLKVEGSESSGSSALQGNPRWLAPERLDPHKYGMSPTESMAPASDVYSFGMVVFELYTNRIPFHEAHNRYIIPVKVLAGERPSHPGMEAIDKGLSDTIWSIAQDCWKDNWEERPRAEELVQRLAAIVGHDAQ